MKNNKEQMKRVVFICIGNIGRSVTGEYLFRQLIEDMDLAGKISVSSAGVRHITPDDEVARTMPEITRIRNAHGGGRIQDSRSQIKWWGNPAYPGTIAALAKRGIDTSKHVSKPLTKEIAETADLIITPSSIQKTTITSAYPSTKDKVYTVDEINGTTDIPLLSISDRNWKPVYKPDWPLKSCGDTGPHCEIMTLVLEWVLKKECGKILSLLGIKRY